MIDARNTFHKISYLQYPFMLVGLYYAFKPYVVGFDTIWENANYGMIFLGLGISFSTLQDTTKTQNKASRKIWESPKKGKLAIVIMAIMAAFLIFVGLFGIYISTSEILKQLAFGVIVLGIGQVGMLKVAIEMFENHRLDKNPLPLAHKAD